MTGNVNAKASAAAKKAAATLSDGQLYAIASTAKNLKNGSFWGFVSKNDVMEHVNAIKSDPNMLIRSISDYAIVEVQPNYILSSISAVDPEIFDAKAVDKIKRNLASAVIEFEKYLVNKGISNPGHAATIGIYSTNNVSTIAYKGVTYPAFRLNLEDTLKILNQYGYEVKVNGQFIPVSKAVSIAQEVFNSLKLSPTKTGAFINIRSTRSPEQLKQAKKQLNAKYGK